MKLDIAATGLNILAAWSPATARLNFNILSGTSMACSHITGFVALLKAVHASWSPSAIKMAIIFFKNRDKVKRNNGEGFLRGCHENGYKRVVDLMREATDELCSLAPQSWRREKLWRLTI